MFPISRETGGVNNAIFTQMECAQLQVTGGGNASPATVSFPGAYKGTHFFISNFEVIADYQILSLGTDPGITINIYQTLKSYTVPGTSALSFLRLVYRNLKYS